MPFYTKHGLKVLAAVIEYCQTKDPSIETNKDLAARIVERGGKLDASQIGKVKIAYKHFPDNYKFRDSTLVNLALGLWVPMSEGYDVIEARQMPRLGFTEEELRAVAEGRVPLRLSDEDKVPPFTRLIESKRQQQGHTYEDVARISGLGPTVELVSNLRKLLLFGGWLPDAAELVPLTVALGHNYAKDLDALMAAQKEGLCRCKEPNGAEA